MNQNFNDLMDWSDGARRTLDREREKMMERVELIDGLAQAMQAVDEIPLLPFSYGSRARPFSDASWADMF